MAAGSGETSGVSGDGDRYPMLAPSYLDGLEERPIDEIRAMRRACVAVETSVSFVRRMVQGRLDIVRAELARRRAGHAPADVAQMIGRLPEILGDHDRPPGLGRLPQAMEPPEPDPAVVARLDELAGVRWLAGLADTDDAELARTIAGLEALEHEVSQRRRSLFERIDALQAELTRRYREGEATVESLLHD